VPGTVETVVSDSGALDSVLPGLSARAFNGYGNVVVVKQLDGTWASYNHLDSISVRAGQTIAAGQQLGTVGNTSNSKFPGMGVHVHFEIRHERPGGLSPFPAPYGIFNVDPARWMKVLGATVQGRTITIPEAQCDVTAVAMRATNPSAFAAAFIEPGQVTIDWKFVTKGQPTIQQPGEEYEPPAQPTAATLLVGLGLGVAALGASVALGR